MSIPQDHSDPRMGDDSALLIASTCEISGSDIRTIKVSNISLAATEQDLETLFSTSGDIQYIELQRESETTHLAYITFKDSKDAETAMILSGAVVINCPISIAPDESYQLPPSAFSPTAEKNPSGAGLVVRKAEDVVSSVLAKGLVLGKDALSKAKAFDEHHHLSSHASATVQSLDQKIGLSEKLKEVDKRFQVSEKTWLALSAAEEKASSARSALLTDRNSSTGGSWVSSALNIVAKVAEDVTLMTKEKFEKAEDEKKESIFKERMEMVKDFAQIHLDDEPTETAAGESAGIPADAAKDGELHTK